MGNASSAGKDVIQMWGYESFCCGFGWWCAIPVAMIIMIALCFLMMRGRMGWMMCGPHPEPPATRLGTDVPSQHGRSWTSDTLGAKLARKSMKKK